MSGPPPRGLASFTLTCWREKAVWSSSSPASAQPCSSSPYRKSWSGRRQPKNSIAGPSRRRCCRVAAADCRVLPVCAAADAAADAEADVRPAASAASAAPVSPPAASSPPLEPPLLSLSARLLDDAMDGTKLRGVCAALPACEEDQWICT